MPKGIREPVTVDGVTYPSKSAASIALYAQGIPAKVIANLIGSTPAAVEVTVKKAKKAREAKGEDTAGIWTAEKAMKVRRLFGHTMIEIAAAVQVPPGELLKYVLHGVIPPSHKVQVADDIGWNDAPVAALPPPEEPDHVDAEPADTWVYDPEATFNIMLLVDVLVTREEVDRWTHEQCRLAEEWAGAVHLSASDHDDIEVPARPDFVRVRPIGTQHPITGAPIEADPDRENDEAELARLQASGGNQNWEDEDVPYGINPATAPTIVNRIQEPAPAPARFPDPAPETRKVASAAGTRALIPTDGLFPANCEVRLTDGRGKYLHESLDGMTDKLKHAWQGGRSHFDTVKARMPKVIKKLQMEVVL